MDLLGTQVRTHTLFSVLQAGPDMSTQGRALPPVPTLWGAGLGSASARAAFPGLGRWLTQVHSLCTLHQPRLSGERHEAATEAPPRRWSERPSWASRCQTHLGSKAVCAAHTQSSEEPGFGSAGPKASPASLPLQLEGCGPRAAVASAGPEARFSPRATRRTLAPRF